jgi:hypothetical protein
MQHRIIGTIIGIVALAAAALPGTAQAAVTPATTISPQALTQAQTRETQHSTTAIPTAQCHVMLAVAHLVAADTSCIHTVSMRVLASPGPVTTAYAWQYGWKSVQDCFGVWWNGCYFLQMRADSWFQWNGVNVYVAQNPAPNCHKDREVTPYSGSYLWCGYWNNGGWPIVATNGGHWMNEGQNIWVCITDKAATACIGYWSRVAVDINGNSWIAGGTI